MVLQSFFQSITSAVSVELQPALFGAIFLVPVLAWLLIRSATSKPVDPSVRLPICLSTTLPIVGDLLEVLRHKHDRHDWFLSLCRQFKGEPFQLRIMGRTPATIVCSPQAAEDILKIQFDSIAKGKIVNEAFRDLLGHGIFAVDGAKWVHQRKTASNLFTARALRETMTESMRRYTIVLHRILLKACEEGKEIDMFKLMNRFTIEAFGRMGFGIDMNCLESEVEHPFQSAFDNSQRILSSRFQRPDWFWRLQRMLSLGNEGRLKRDIATIDKTVMDIVAQSLQRRQQQNGKKDSTSADIVSLFLDRFDESTGEQFDPTYLRDIVVNFLIAGRDTTAQVMSWCFYNLSLHPEVVAKIREEIAEILPDFANGSRTDPPTMEEVQQLTYLDSVLKETLRLHPSVPLLPKTVLEDVVMSDGTLLKAGSSVAISAYSMARLESVWGPDATEFKPERWIDPATGKQINVSAFKFPSFNAGPRICLGMNLAMLEMKIVMASMVSRFNVNFVAPEKITYDNSLTLAVKGPMLAHITKA